MQTESEAVYLKQVPLFAGLEDEDIRELMSVAKRRTFRSGEVIFHREDPGQVLYVIKEGKVKISLISPDGQEISLVVFGKGECFGEIAILDGLSRSADAIAMEKVECYTLQRSDGEKVSGTGRHTWHQSRKWDSYRCAPDTARAGFDGWLVS